MSHIFVFICAILLSLSGHLYLNTSLDYESQHVHILTVQATDNGIPSLSSTQILTVEVQDVNDQPPVFQQQVYNTTVMENRERGEVVFTVTAVDMDSGTTSKSHCINQKNLYNPIQLEGIVHVIESLPKNENVTTAQLL